MRRVVYSHAKFRAAFAPPKGLKKVVPQDKLEDFDHDKLKQKLANGCELWAIRLPEGVRTTSSCLLHSLAHTLASSSNCGISPMST